MKNKKIGSILKESITNIKKIIKSNEMLCAMYGFDYEKNNNLSSYNEYMKIWNESSDSIKAKIVSYFYSLNNYEMLKRLADINNLGKIHQIIGEFVRNRYSEENLENKKIKKVK